ncbi:MAG: YdhR family protein [Deltaproteobacteria bacterium]|nr:YdhR family protein [Deltaproteobacteria bacterium]
MSVEQCRWQVWGAARAEYEQVVSSVAGQFAAVAGLRWKIWIINEEEQEAGGIYLFDDEASVKEYLAGPLAAGLTGQPAFSDISMKQFDVMEDQTAITRGPV